jgi:DNA segregation ATPase FtsK/SpoIIIE, S-DNA-T family
MAQSWIDSDMDDHVEKLAAIVSGYFDGLAMIDREFDEACQRISQSIDNIRGKSTKSLKTSTREQIMETELRQKCATIEQKLADIDNRIARLDQGISAVESSIQELSRNRASLEQQIQNRWLIERIIYLFLFDRDKQRYAQLRNDLDKKADDKTALEETKRRFETKRTQLANNRDSLQASLDNTRKKLLALITSSANDDEQVKHLTDKNRYAEERRRTRRKNLLKSISAGWNRASNEIMQDVAIIRRRQPAFTDLHGSDSCLAHEMPHNVIIGEKEISFKHLTCLIPHAISFPFTEALVLPEENQAQLRLSHHLLLRLMQAIPPGQLELTLIDPLKLGQSFAPFLPLLSTEQLMPQRRILTRADEIERILASLTDETENLIQNRFKGRISDWTAFNEANHDNPIRYMVILLYDIPEQLSDRSLWYLERLIENGPRCGILPILAVDDKRIEDKRYTGLHNALKQSAQRLDALLPVEVSQESGLSHIYRAEEWPREDRLDQFLSTLADRYAKKGRFNRALSDLWVNCEKGSTSLGGMDIPIGWTASGETVSLVFGATNSEHHVLLAGKTGSGKSNLLHVLIHSMCEKYAPQEIDLYLLDYKESTEFSIYANPILPHICLVATESDPEYGVTVLKHLADELESRAQLFKSAGVRDFAEYRNAQRTPLARVLLIIDEFQVLFTAGRQVADSAEKLLARLLKQGRSFGIHILLSTQTLKGIDALSLGALISQLGCRIALACGQEDSALVLGGNNPAAAELRSPPEGIINNSNGAKSGNVIFKIPYAEQGFCYTHQKQLSERASRRSLGNKARVFNGAKLPSMPSPFEMNRAHSQCNGILLGEKLTFTADMLSIPLVKRQSFNVLFCGYDEVIHDGLLGSLLASLSLSDAFDDVVYFDGRGISTNEVVSEASSGLGDRLMAFSDVTQLPLKELSDSIGVRRVALIVDGLDGERTLHPVQPFAASRPGAQATSSDLFKRILEEGPVKGTFVFAFIENWRRSAVSCRELLNSFEMRVAFCMNEDDAGALVSGGSIGKFKGIERPNRAVFINRMKNEIHWFRPYIHRTKNETC